MRNQSRKPRTGSRPHVPAAAMVLCAFAAAILAPAAAPAQEVPGPEVGTSPQTVLALLDYNRNLCDRIAGKVVERWQGLGDSPEAVEAVRKYLVDEELSELAAGRAAADIIRGFMKQVRSESSPATVDSLVRIGDLIQDLCDSVAWPTPPQENFAAKLRTILEEIEQERLDLGKQLVVKEAELRQLVSPYLAPIQLAGVEAHDEYLDYLESIKPKPRGPTLKELVQAWYLRYEEATRPTKTALANFVEARNHNDTQAIGETCKEITAAVIPLLRDDDLFKIPTQQRPASKGIKPELIPSLQQAYREIRDVAANCSAANQREVIKHYAEMEKQLQEAAEVLALYSLAP